MTFRLRMNRSPVVMYGARLDSVAFPTDHFHTAHPCHRRERLAMVQIALEVTFSTAHVLQIRDCPAKVYPS
jgi:hypothetical protein